MTHTPTAYIMVGLPGSGKTSWIESQDWMSSMARISTDDIIEAMAVKSGKSYNEVFKESMSDAVMVMVDRVDWARACKKDIVWDQTSTTVASRAKKLHMLKPYGYTTIAVEMEALGRDEHMRRLSSRPGKTIPEKVFSDMLAGYVSPTTEEGFDEVWRAVSTKGA